MKRVTEDFTVAGTHFRGVLLCGLLVFIFNSSAIAQTPEITSIKGIIKQHEQEIGKLKQQLSSLEQDYAVRQMKTEIKKTGGLLTVAVNGSAQLKNDPNLLSDNILEVPSTDSLLLVKRYPENFWMVMYNGKPYYVNEHWIQKSEKFQLIKNQQKIAPLNTFTPNRAYQSTPAKSVTSSSACGAPTKTTGAPCKRVVKGGGYCYQHS